jgi:hypothetical protein
MGVGQMVEFRQEAMTEADQRRRSADDQNVFGQGYSHVHVRLGRGEMGMGVWQGAAVDALKFHPGPPRPLGGLPLIRLYGRFRGGPRPSSTLLDIPCCVPVLGVIK